MTGARTRGARLGSALVTGASSGLGRALALRLASSHHVVLLARREAALSDVADAIARGGGHATVCAADLSDSDRAASVIEELDHEHAFDLVIANAGAGPAEGPPWRWSTLRQACQLNFCSAAATLTAPLDGMIARGGGHLVGISSLSSFGAFAGSAAYCAPKAGLNMLLDCLRLDLAPHGIAVTTVYAGFIDTPMVAQRSGKMPQLMTSDAAARRIVSSLPSRPRSITFPEPLGIGARVLGALPTAWRDRLVRGLG
jgi:short-subunit dehydrogenase